MTVFLIATARSTTTITQSGQPAQTRPTTSGAKQAHQAPKRFHLSQELPSAENLAVLVKIEIFDNIHARNDVLEVLGTGSFGSLRGARQPLQLESKWSQPDRKGKTYAIAKAQRCLRRWRGRSKPAAESK